MSEHQPQQKIEPHTTAEYFDIQKDLLPYVCQCHGAVCDDVTCMMLVKRYSEKFEKCWDEIMAIENGLEEYASNVPRVKEKYLEKVKKILDEYIRNHSA